MKLNQYIYGYLCLQLLFSACNSGDIAPLPSVAEGGEASLLFTFPSVDARALGASPSVENLVPNTVFSVYAYRDGVNVGTGVYQVSSADATQASAVTIGGEEKVLKLTKGKYDLHFFSYNATGTGTDEYPTLSLDGSGKITQESKVTVPNGKDFLSTSLESIEIQADQTSGSTSTGGTKTFTVSMKEAPFRHLCARVKATLEVQQKPVAPQKVTELSVKVKNLAAGGTYVPGGKEITTSAREDKNEATFTFSSMSSGSGGFTPDFNASSLQNQCSSDETFLLPVDASPPLKFDLSMKVKYTSTQTGGGSTEKEQLVQLTGYELSKQLQAGKSYNFVFRLTFYGDYKPVGVTLDIQEYTPVKLPIGGVGED
jgi:hypothetical protein